MNRSTPPGRRAFRRVWRARCLPPPSASKTEEEDMAELCARHAVNASRVHWKSDANAWLERRHAAIAPELTAARQAQLRQLYRVIDTDGSGELDFDELETALLICGYTKAGARETILAMFSDLGKDVETDDLNFSEFCRMVVQSESRGGGGGGGQKSGGGISFGVMLRTFQRKRLLEEVLSTYG